MPPPQKRFSADDGRIGNPDDALVVRKTDNAARAQALHRASGRAFIFYAAAGRSMNLRLGNSAGPLQKVEIASLVRLLNVLGKHAVITARVIARRRPIALR